MAFRERKHRIMETLLVIFAIMFLLKLTWDKIRSLFGKKRAKSTSHQPELSKDDPRSKAISGLMKNLQKAKLNRPEIIEENPELAVQVLKAWVNKDKKGLN